MPDTREPIVPVELFYSYAHKDEALRNELVKHLSVLEREKVITSWHDRMIGSGADWAGAIDEHINSAQIILLLVSADFLASNYCYDVEMRRALERHASGEARVIPVILRECDWQGAPFGKLQALPRNGKPAVLWPDLDEALADAAREIRKVVERPRLAPDPLPPPSPTASGPCPYRGLEPFDPEHAEFFFGREELTKRLLEKLKQVTTTGQMRFLAVIGQSGSGKSSLALAGLVPALRRGESSGGLPWRVEICRPGSDPIENLAKRLVGLGNTAPKLQDLDDLIEKMKSGPTALQRLVDLALRDEPSPSRLVVLLDQFEEVFTQCENAELRQEFVSNLLYAASKPGSQTVVVLTLRADFYGRCASDPALAAALPDHQLLVGPMTEDELRSAIERPARVAGCELEAGLTEMLLQDVERQAGALPLLQFALRELWEHREGYRMTLAAYRAMGGLEGALENRANMILSGFSPPEQDLCRRVFLRLTQPGEGTEDTKRRARMRDLLGDGGEAIGRVVQQLVDARLLTAGRDEGSGSVEVAHEALIRGWHELRQWIEADRSGLRTHHRLTEAAHEWDEAGRAPSFLYTGARLAVAREWAEKHGNDLNALESEFLTASLEGERSEEAAKVEAAKRDAERDAALERERAERASERLHRSRTALAVAAVALVMVGSLAAFALTQWRRAETLKKKADTSARVASESADAARQQSQLAMATLNSVIVDIQRSLEGLPASSQVRIRLLDTALKQIDKLSKGYVEKSIADRETAVALSEMGELILRFGATAGQRSAASVQADSRVAPSAVKSAERLLTRSREIQESLLAASPSSTRLKQQLSFSYVSLGDVYLRLGSTAGALRYYQKYRELNQSLAEAAPKDSQSKRELSISFNKLGEIYLKLSENDKALEFYRQSLALREALAQENPSDTRAKRDLFLSYNHLGDMYSKVRTFETARSFHQKALEACEAQVRSRPDDASVKHDLSISCQRLGDVELKLGQTSKALEFYQRGLALRESLANADPNDAQNKRALAISYHELGDVYVTIKDFRTALEYFKKDVALSEKQAQADVDDADAKRDLAVSYNKLGDVHLELGDTDAALGLYKKSVALGESLAARDSSNVEARQDLAYPLWKIAKAYEQAKNPVKARQSYEKRLALGLPNAVLYNDFAWLLATTWDDSARNGKVALELASKACDLSERKNPVFLDTLAAAHAEAGQFDEAVKWQKKALELAGALDGAAVEELKQHLQLFEAQKAYREERPKPSATDARGQPAAR